MIPPPSSLARRVCFLVLLPGALVSGPATGTAEIGDEPLFDTLAGQLPGVLFAGKGPYRVVADVYVPAGKTVSIEAGTVLLFKNFTGLQVMGRLRANGTRTAPVVFTSENDTACNPHSTVQAAPYDWNGVFLLEDAVGSHLSHVHTRYSVEGITSLTRFIRLESCVFRHNGRADFTIEGEEKIIEHQPYNYALSVDNATDAGIPVTILRDPLAVRRNLTRYSGIALAVGGCITGALYTANLQSSSRKFDRLCGTDPQNLAENSSSTWRRARSDRNADAALTIAGWVLGALGGGALVWSFTF